MRQEVACLAWLQLAKDKLRLAAAVAGITFAVVLMLVQLGFKETLIESAALLYSHVNADLALINPDYQYILATKNISKRRLYQALSFKGVQSVGFINLGVVPWKNPQTLKERIIFLVGLEPRIGVFDLPAIDAKIPELRNPDTVLYDVDSLPDFGPISKEFSEHQRVMTEVSGRKIQVVGLFKMGTSFGVDGTVITSDLNFCRLLSTQNPKLASIGLIKLKAGVDPEKMRDLMAAALPRDVRVLTRRQLIELERGYWTTNTPIGFIFNLGVLMGLFVGCIIVYQILYTDVSDHLSEYATLKAMGYPDRYLFSVVIQEALILSLCGFLPGLIVSLIVYRVAAAATLLPLQMTVQRALIVYLLTAAMCALSGALAMRRLNSADPAEIF